MPHGDHAGDVRFEHGEVAFRCFCGQEHIAALAAIRFVCPRAAHVGSDFRAAWTIDIGMCARCGAHHFLNPNLPAGHPHPNARFIELLVRTLGAPQALAP